MRTSKLKGTWSRFPIMFLGREQRYLFLVFDKITIRLVPVGLDLTRVREGLGLMQSVCCFS